MIDITYIIFVLPALILSLIASAMVNRRFSAYDNLKSRNNITGAEAAKLLLEKNGIYDVKIAHISGSLTDNYNPAKKTLSLSDSTYNSTSIAAIGVAAHETGHAIQHKVAYKPLVLRSTLVPVANLGSRLGPILAILGIILGQSSDSTFAVSMINIGLILFGCAVLFYIVTLPVEFNASHRALKILKETNTLDSQELYGAKKVLWAAAMTYVASALAAIGSLLRLLVLSRNSRRR